MKKFNIRNRFIILFIIVMAGAQTLYAQGYGGTLTMQGLDNLMLHSARARAMGGLSVTDQKDIGLMFQNPAALRSIDKMILSVGGHLSSSDLKQEQNYAPVRYYSNLSLLLEGLTDQIPDPDPSLFGFTAQDTVQRPYDNLSPNWSRSASDQMPLQALLAAPFSFGEFYIVAGAGAVRYADLNHYYQNNNVLSPEILSQRPLPTLRPTDDNPVEVQWLQSYRSREGYIQGYGFAVAGHAKEYNISLGFSGLILQGNSDDYQQQISRGKLTFFSNAFRIDSVSNSVRMSGTSDYSGQEFTVSSIITGRYVSFGFSVKLPTTITRTYSTQIMTENGDGSSSETVRGEDKLKLPWRGTVGLSFTLRENLSLGIEYEYRPYESVRYTDTNGRETSPWLPASLFRIGVEYKPALWLALRGGMRGEAEVFEPEGNQLPGEPITYMIYSAGFGISYYGIFLDVAYEYALLKYEDIWASAISKNSNYQHMFVAQLSYELPFLTR
jgi:opacity protein-like surface antigen